MISKLYIRLIALLLILPQAGYGIALPNLSVQHSGSFITVKGNTDLKGAVISSSDQAVADNKNTFTTATLTTSEIQNRSEYDALSVNVSGGTGGVGAPLVLNAEDKDTSTTRSGISGAAITLTDNKKQQVLTGKDATTTVASLNRDVATGKDTSGAIANNLDVAEIQASFTVTQAFVQQANTFIATKAQKTDQASTALKKELAKPEAQRDQTVIEQANQTLQDNATWAMGGTGRTILTAITAAAGGNVTGGASQMVQAATVNYLQSLGVQEIKQIADSLKDNNSQPTTTSEAVRTALQGIAACAGASAQGANCGSAALGASASVVLSNLMSDPQGLTAQQKDTRKNLISSLVTGVTAATGGDAASANTAAQIELENNSEFSRMRGAIVATIQSAAERSRSFKTREPTKSELLAVMKDLSAQLRRTDLNTDERQGLHALWMNLNDLGQHYKILDASTLPPEMYSIGMASMALSGGGNIAVKSVGVTVPKLPRTQSEFVPVSSGANTVTVENYVASLKTKVTPTSTNAGLFEAEQTGPLNYRVTGGGTAIDADGYAGTTLLDAKYVGNPKISPYVDNSNVPSFLKDKILMQQQYEFQRYKAVIDDPAIPFNRLNILTNEPAATPYFQRLMDLNKIPGEVKVVPTNVPQIGQKAP